MKRTVFAILIMPCLAFAAPQANSTIDLELLDSLLRVKSVSRDKPNLRKAVDVLKTWLEARGVKSAAASQAQAAVNSSAASTP